MNDGVREFGSGGVTSQVPRPDFASFDDAVDGLGDDVRVSVKLHVAQHAGGSEQHCRGVGSILSDGT